MVNSSGPIEKGKDAMRRLALRFTALGLLSAACGCHHLAGVCDCDYPTYDHPVPALAMPVQVPAPTRLEPIKVAPSPAPALTPEREKPL
jgi:hypothetical protein